MKYTYPRHEFRSSRTFVANLLAFMLLASQLAPLASAQGTRGGAIRQQPAKAKGAQPGRGERDGGDKVNPTLAAPAAVTIVATKTDNVPQATLASPGATINYTVTISNNGSDPATNVVFNDTVDANTTLVAGSVSTQPIANPDAYNVIGNVPVVPNASQGLLANDCDPDNGATCSSAGLTASGPNSAPSNGQVTISSDGSFTYTPNAGYNGPDSFTYTVTDGQGKTDTATATLTVSAPIWFVRAGAAAGGDGRLDTPFNCYTGPDVPAISTCFSATAADEAGDAIFLYDGSYTGGYALLANQKLVGQGASASLAAIHDNVTVEPYSKPLPATDGTPAEVQITTTLPGTHTVPVSAGGITLRGFTAGATGGAKIFGNNFGTLTVGNSTTPDVTLSGAGAALSLTNGSFAATSGFTGVETTGALGAPGFLLSNVSGTVSFGTTSISGAGADGIDIVSSAVNATFGATTVSGSTAIGILVSSSTGNVTFGATAVSGGTDGVLLQSNTGGTRTFASLSVSNNSAVGLNANAPGNLTVTGATLVPAVGQTAPASTGIDIKNLASGTTASFGATTVNKGNSGTGVSLGGALVANGNAGSITFSSLDVTTSSGVGLFASNNTGQLTVSGGSIASTGGAAMNISKDAAPASPVTLSFSTVSSANSNTHGVMINRVSGNVTVGTSTTATNPTNTGITVQNSGAGTVSFGNTSATQSGGTGVFLTNNTANVAFADLDINPDANQRAFHATDTDAATAAGTITTTSGDVQAAGNVALEIVGASAAARTPLALVLNNLDSTNSATNGVDLNLVSGNLAVNDPGVATNIVNAGNNVAGTGIGIRVLNSAAGGTFSFGNTSVTGSGSTGVVLGTAANGNAGNVTFNDLDITPDSGQRAFHATHNTGTVSTTSGTIAAVNGIAVEIVGQSNAARSPLNMALTSVSATASGGNPANGIVLTSVNGPGASIGFSVVGDNSNTARGGNATGGTISNTAGADAASGGIGVRLENADEVALRRMQINDHPNFAVYSLNSSNVTLAFTTVSGANGTNPNGTFFTDEASVLFANMTGAASVDRCKISGGIENNMTVVNDTGTLNRLVIDDTEFGLNNTSLGADSLLIVASGLAANPASTVNVTIEDSDFLGARGDVIQTDFRENGKLDVVMERNEISNAHTNIVSAGGGATFSGNGNALTGGTPNFTYNIGGTAGNGNTFRGAKGTGVAIDMGTGVSTGRFRNNTIGVQAVANSGASDVGAGGFAYIVDPGGTNTVLIDNNQIFQYNNHGILLQVGDLQGLPTTTNMTVTNNLVSTPGTTVATNFNAIHLNHGTVDAPADTTTSCVDILSNNVAAGAKGTTLPNAADIRLRQRQATTVRLPGYAGANNDNTAVQNYLVSRNTTRAQPNGAAASNTVGGVPAAGGGYIGGAACTQPTNPSAPVGADTAPPTELSAGAAAAAAPQPVFAPVAAPVFARPAAALAPQPAATAAAASVAAAASSAKPEKAAAAKSSAKDASLDKAEKPSKRPINVIQSGETVTVNIGTLVAGDSVQITFSVTINNSLPAGTTQVSNQGTVSGTGFSPVLTDDPDAAGAADPTVTLVLGPPDVTIRDASVGEPASGSTQRMAFPVVLSHAFNQTVTVDYATANGGASPATGGANCGDPGVDYKSGAGTLTFAAGQTVQSVSVEICSDAEADDNETLLVNLSNPTNANLTADTQAVGTITPNTPGTVLISELRTSGPGASGTGDPADEFVEIYNNSDADATVPAGGWGLFKMGATCADTPVLIGTVPAGTIPGRGHFLFVGTGYSLANYGGTNAAAGNATFAAGVEIENDRNVGLFSTTDPLQLSTANRLDAVGFGTANVGNNCDLLSEGTNLPAAAGSTAEHTFVRNQTTGKPLDRNNNAGDFLVLSTTAGAVGDNPTPRLGAPGPQNLTSPVNRSASIKASLADPMGSPTGGENRVRDTTSDPANNSTFGTLKIRRKFTNTTGVAVTQLRFRVVDITAGPNAPAGVADLRVRTSSTSTINLTGGGTAQVQGLTLETPPAQPMGGGWNSTVAAGTITPGTPLGSGGSLNVEFLLGLQQTGTFRFFIIVEALAPGSATPPGKPAGEINSMKAVGRGDDSKDVPQN